MSSVEERLVRDIETITRGVVVTHADVEQARDQVEERIGQSSRRARLRWSLAAAATAAVVAGVGGVVLAADRDADTDSAPADSVPSPPVDDPFLVGEAPASEDLTGVWRVDNGMTLVSFTADNAIAIDTRGQIADAELAGTYTLEGDQVVVDLGQAGQPGCTGEVVFGASVNGPGEVRMALAEPSSNACGFEQSGRWVLEHLLPTRKGYTRFGPPSNGDYGPLRRAVLPGFWMVKGGGHGLQLSPEGSYSVLDGSGQVVENGQWQLEGDLLELESERGCRVGISDVQHINPGTDMIRGDLTEYVCETAWASGEWFQIPDRSNF